MNSIEKTLAFLSEKFPYRGALELNSPYRSLIAVLLSARTRDEQVLKLLPAFFKRFPSVHQLAEAEIPEITNYLKTIGMFRQKAKNIKALAQKVIQDFDGEIPDNLEELITLPGVGRKTASVVLPYLFNKPAIAVDVHVHRVANRLNWVKTKSPAQTEKELLNKVSKKYQSEINRALVKFGRYICTSQKPKCDICPLKAECPFENKNLEVNNDSSAVYAKINEQEKFIDELREKASK